MVAKALLFFTRELGLLLLLTIAAEHQSLGVIAFEHPSLGADRGSTSIS
jgi:hypothetical protein